MTEELSKKTGDEISRRPYANNFVIDDPFAMDGILEQVCASVKRGLSIMRKCQKRPCHYA